MDSLTSAEGLIALLRDDDTEIKVYALERLDQVVDSFWAEIADSIDEIEKLTEDESFPQRQLASLLASKVYYHLGALDDALQFALEAGTCFDVASKSLYARTIISRALDLYVEKREAGQQDEALDAKLVGIVNRMFNNSLNTKQFKQAIGMAIEAHRLDILEQAIHQSGQVSEMLAYTFDVAMSVVTKHQQRTQVLRAIARQYTALKTPEYRNLLQCYVVLGEAADAAGMLRQLVGGDEHKNMVALQLAFDIYDRASQRFVEDVMADLKKDPLPNNLNDRFMHILSGNHTLRLNVEFLSRSNNTDMLLLSKIKDLIKQNTQLHNATVLSHMLMSAGTTSDDFLRNNREWLMKATNWAKFAAVGSLGVIHQGHVHNAMNVLKPYLPKDGVSSSNYEAGGGLYALGLVHANHGASVVEYLVSSLSETNVEVVQHGACLGLGLASLGSNSDLVHQQLWNVLSTDSAVAGEAAGIAIGLNKLGAADDTAINDMIEYAQDTQHEKIIRGIAIGVALNMFNRQEQADAVIDRLFGDKDGLVRMSGCHTIATAYAGTNDNRVIKRLLHVAVSDVNDDVRRAAVTSLGFLLLRTPEQIPSVVSLLSESFNPHVRVGSCMALGIGCAATGLQEAISLIEPMLEDPVPFVRQGALVALSMIMMQQSNNHPKADFIRKKLLGVLENKIEDVLAKFGAIIGMGILNAGGRNVTISVCRNHGHIDAASVTGLLVFTQFWYWYPLTHFLSLAFSPTAVIALNKNLKMPKLKIRSDAPPSKFAYPPATEAPKEKNKEKVATAILSVTKRQAAKDKKTEEETKMDDKPDEEPEEKQEEPEPEFTLLENPARVVPQQVKLVSIDDSRYHPVFENEAVSGVVLVTDTRPEDAEDLIEMEEISTTSATESSGVQGGSGGEPSPPPPFEFNVDLEQE